LVSVDDGYPSIYINGVYRYTSACYAEILTADFPLWIGGSPSSSEDHALDARIDEVRIWSVARSANAIGQDWASDVDPNAAGLEVWLDFDGGLVNRVNGEEASAPQGSTEPSLSEDVPY